MMRSFSFACALIIAVCCALVLSPEATAQVAGTNVNMVSGQKWPTGDPFLQRQNEPSMAVSTRNPLHILAGANDYRSVDLELVLSGGEETGDSWLGIFKSFDGGLTWQSTLLPGCPQLVPQCVDSGALKGGNYQAGADPVVRAGTNGMFYYAGLAFDRPTSPTTASPTSAIFVARYNDLNNNENLDPITYIDTHIVARGDNSQFLDKPALAVDIPRAGAATCSFTANEPGAGPNGGTLAVHQSFPTGNIYLAYTDFLAGTKANTTPTHLMFTHSTDCGVTWSAPVQINTGTTTSQGSAIAVNPVNGNVYVAWRQFASTGVSNAIMVAQSTNAGKSFSKPTQISTFQPFDQGTTGTSFRTNAYPSLTTDMFGFVYVAFSARGLISNGDARVVAAGSIDGTHWTPAIMVDNPSQNGQTNPSGRGHQIMPAITFANGRLTLLYYDLRLDHYANSYTPSTNSPTGYTSSLQPEGELAPPNTSPSKVFTPFIDDNGLTLRRHTLDLRVLQLGIFPTVALGPSVLVSQYEYGCCLNPNMPDIEQYKFNVPNLPLFAQGEAPFLGDYIDVVPSPMFVPNGNSWAYNFTPSVNPLFHATWTDNRDVVPPRDGNWQHYTPPVPVNTPSVFEPGNTVAFCVSGQEGMRNQNIYTAQITGGLVVGAPGNSKPLGTTTFNNQTVPFQRAFPVVAQNVTNQPLNVRFSIANQPTGGSASFQQFSLLTTLDVTIPAQSSVSRSVFVTSSNPSASVTVNVTQIAAIGGSTVNNGLSSSTVLNPDITNPAITNPAITNPAITNPAITNFEVTNPAITNPAITNPAITNPAITNPAITNPAITNPAITNPAITNPAITNPAITNPAITNASATNPAITNPAITNPDITNPAITNPAITNPAITNGAIQDVTYAITNQGNTDASYTVRTATNTVVPGGIVLQLILSKLYQTPGANNCVLGAETHLVTVANITNPKLYSVNDPQLGNPNATNSVPNEASVTLAPGETAYITLRVVNPTPATTPFNPAAALTPVTIPQAVNTQTVLANPPGNPPPPPPVVFPQLTISSPATLPATDQGNPGYSFQLQAIGGKPGADTWSIIAGALPNGMNLSSSGLISGSTVALAPNSATIRVTDGAGNTTSKAFSIPVNNLFTANTQGIINDGVVGQSYIAFPFSTTGGTTPIIWAATGLPGTLPINTATGQISGTPAVANVAGYTVHATATDSALPPNVLSRTFTIRVGDVIAIAPTVLLNGTIGVSYGAQLTASGGIGSYVFGPPSPAAGVLLSSTGALTITNPQTPAISFSVSVHDQANPNQFANANYAVMFAPPAGPNVTFVTQPPNYMGGQPNPNSPVHIRVTDNSNAAVSGASVTMSLNGTPPCASATLSGTLTQQTSATGDAFFGDLSVDRGQIGYQMRATVASVFAVSNPFTVNGFCGTGGLNVARDNLTATLLQNGQVLMAGGQGPTGTTPSNAAELYDPATGAFTSITGMNGARYSHTATLLNNGTVLIVGGQTDSSTFLATAEIFNPGNGTFTTAINHLISPRSGHTATLLADGTVLIAGGFNGNVLSSAELYDPATQTFTSVGPLNSGRFTHTATLLASGKVLIATGLDNSAELYDPVAKTFATTGNLNTSRQSPTATLLTNGKVLIVGGLLNGSTGIGTAELYDPAAGTFSFTGNLNTARGGHTATLLPDGTVLVAAGFNVAVQPSDVLGTAEIYDPVNGIFSVTGSLINARWQDTATLLNDGTVLVAGGFSGNSPTGSAERYYSTSPLAALQVTTPTTLAAGQPSTSVFSNSTAFNGAATGLSTVGFNGILPAGTPNEDFNPLIVGGYSFSTTNPNTFVNVTTATFYNPSNYPADFIIDSSNPGPNNELTIVLPQPTRALGMNYGGFGGGSSGTISLSNGFVFPLSNLPAVGQTQFSGFVSATPFSSLTLVVNNDSWAMLNLLAGTANTALPSATEGTPYTQMLLEQGGVGPLTWTLASGNPPLGLSLTPSGILVGTPTTSGSFTFAVHLVDSSSPPKAVTSGSLTMSVVPQPPTNVAPGPVSVGSIGLIWEFSLSGDVTGYNVYRATTSGGPYTNIGSLPASAFSFTDTAVTTGTTYYYVVRAAAGAVESANSNEVPITAP